MDRLSRLICGGLLLALLAFWMGPAFAQFAPPPTSTWTVQNFMGSPPYGGQPTVAAFCGPGWGQAGYLNGGNCEAYCRNESPSSPPLTTTERNLGRFFSVGGNSGNTYTFNCGIPGTTCPANSTLSGSTCQCNSGYQLGPDGQSCMRADACSASNLGDNVMGPYTTAPGGASTFYTCGDGVTTGTQANCLIEHTRTMTGQVGGQWYQWVSSRRVAGPNCTPGAGGTSATQPAPGASGPAFSEPRPEPCPTGQCRGSVNGTSVCMPCASQTSTPTTTTTQNGSGTTTGTTSTSTTCTGSTCTTTTQTRDGSGTLTGTTTTTTTYGQHCAANPGAPQCNGGSGTGTGGNGNGDGEGEGEGSSFGGSCAAGFSCEGDAVQCAIARDQHIRACQFYDTTTDLSTLGANAVAAAASQPAGHPGLTPETVDLSLSDRINQSPLFGGTTCPSDVTATMLGQTVTLPFSDLCGYLNLMGTAGVLAALLAAAMIVFRTNG